MFYEIIFNNEAQAPAQTISQAVNACFGFLEAIIREYVDSPNCKHDEKAWVAIFDPVANAIRNCDRILAESILAADDELTLYAKTTRIGNLQEARVKKKTTECVGGKSPSTDISHRFTAAQQASDLIKKIITSDDPAAQNWKPSDIHEGHILRSAETRLFAIRLRKLINKVPISSRFVIDRGCDFTEGTIGAMLHPVNPLRPTKIQIDKIARYLRVNPSSLWIDLLPYYVEQTGGWPVITNLETSK